jgi:glutathione S-transferase
MAADVFLLIGNKKYSSWSLRPWLVLKHSGIDFEEQLVPLDRPDTTEKILAFSPSGRVPFLRHGKIEVWESLAILEYLAERFSGASLWPADAATRAEAQAQIASAAQFAQVPLQHAAQAYCQKHWQQPQTGSRAEALCNNRGNQRHEHDRHRQSVPNEPCVTWAQVIVRRTECRKQESPENNQVRPAFPPIDRRH